MQIYLDNINELLLSWFAIIMSNPVYQAIAGAAVVAVLIWLVMIINYQLKLAKLRGTLRKTESAHETERQQLHTEIDNVKEQLHYTASELDAKTVQLSQLEAEQLKAKALIDRTLKLEKQAKHLVDTLQTEFYLPGIAQAELAETLGQTVQQVVTRLKTATQEHLAVVQAQQQTKQVLSENAALIEKLQLQLSDLTAQQQTLEQDYKAQKSAWQQEQAQLHEELQLLQASQQENLSKIAELEAKPQPVTFAAAASSVTQAIIEPATATLNTLQHEVKVAVEAVEEAVTPLAESVIESVTEAVAPLEEMVENVVENVTEVVTEVEQAAESSLAQTSSKFSSFMGSLKGLGASKKASPVVESAPEIPDAPSAPAEAPAAPESAAVTEDSSSPASPGLFGKLKSFGSSKKSSVAVAVETPEAPVEVATDEVIVESKPSSGTLDKMKGWVNFKKPAAVEDAKPEEASAEPEPFLDSMLEKLETSNVNKMVPEKLKDIYRKIMSV